MGRGHFDSDREAVYALIGKAVDKRHWIVKGKEWFTPEEFLALAIKDRKLVIGQFSPYKLGDPYEAIKSAEKILERLKTERNTLIARINECQARGRQPGS